MPPVAPDWLDELQLTADGPPWLSMGLGRVADEHWLLPDEHRDAELDLRRRLLAERPADVFAARPGTEAAGAEVLTLVQRWFAAHRPDLGFDPPPPGCHPLEAAGRATQEDLVLMVPHDGRHHLDAACLCFPSHWRLADKIGGSAQAIHGPVPRYDAELSTRVDRFLARLREGTISARRNWSVHESADLFAPVRPAPSAPPTPEQVADALWLRSERQTLRRLPTTSAVLFTIRVQQAPLGVLAERPDVAARLAARLRAQPDELTDMNGLAPHRAAVLAWLDLVVA
ncbi:MAG: hypothetical protein JWM05_280 [Acidimicrobiales bacterium]|nr:hypothetical protein [Acidimicrobiales bacterium]